MALISPRVAHNFAKNGYYPTDDATSNGIIHLLNATKGIIRVLDPVIGEARAASNIAYSLSHDAKLYGVEYNKERAVIAEKRCDYLLHSDLFDTVISPQSFGLLFLNPPYGNLASEHIGSILNYERGYKRLEKVFYRFTMPLLQYDGILVFIIPYTQLDDELSNWIACQFTNITTYMAEDKQFKQVVIIGRKVKQSVISLSEKNAVKQHFKQIANGEIVPGNISSNSEPIYTVPSSTTDIKAFYQLTCDNDSFYAETKKQPCLWNDLSLYFGRKNQITKRQPLMPMSDWHLSLALAAGEISGVISNDDDTYVIKGDTYKTKVKKTETTSDEDGNISIQNIQIDRFVPTIKAWDMNPYSDNFGQLLTISSVTPEKTESEIVEPTIKFELGNTMMTRGIKDEIEQSHLDVKHYLSRHEQGDWGDIDESDKKLNNHAIDYLACGERLLSAYNTAHCKIWIITEYDEQYENNITTVLLPSEY